MENTEEVNELEVVLEQLTADLARASREKAIAVARLATSQQHGRQLQAQLDELRAAAPQPPTEPVPATKRRRQKASPPAEENPPTSAEDRAE